MILCYPADHGEQIVAIIMPAERLSAFIRSNLILQGGKIRDRFRKA